MASGKKLSIVIPCYNEKESILEILDKVKKSPIENKEIIVVDDCSSDGTREILKEKVEPIVDKVIYHEQNTGKAEPSGLVSWRLPETWSSFRTRIWSTIQ